MKRRRVDPDERLLFDLPLEPQREAPPVLPDPPSTATAEPQPRSEPEPEPAAPEPEPAGELFADPPDESDLLDVLLPSAADREPVIASLWPRVLSGGADLLVHAGALAAVALGLYAFAIDPGLALWPAFLAFGLSFSYLYTVVSLAFWGQTAGMAWFGLSARESAQFPLSFSQATLRWLGGLLTLTLLGLPHLLALSGASLSDRLSRSKTYLGGSVGGPESG